VLESFQGGNDEVGGHQSRIWSTASVLAIIDLTEGP
jgi:hypothetical protein